MQAPTRQVLGSISPFFITTDLRRGIEFYRDVLGFEIRVQVPSDEPFFALVGRDSVQILLKDPRCDDADELRALPNSSRHELAPWDAHVFVSDPDALAAEFSSRAPQCLTPVINRDDGLRGFEVRDPDGYVLFFGRPA